MNRLKKLLGSDSLPAIPLRRNVMTVVIAVFAGVGVFLLIRSFAAGPIIHIQGEGTQANRSGQLSVQSDQNASAGSYIQFGGASSGQPGRFYVIGRDIVAPDGSKFYPVGGNVAVNISDGPYVFNLNGKTASGHSDDALAWGWNIVRATLVCNNTGFVSTSQLVSRVNAFIDEYTAKNIVVLIECHDFTATNPSYASLGATNDFFNQLIPRNKDNPYVWYNWLNEPYESNDVSGWLTLQTAIYNNLRSQGAENILVADVPGYGQGIESVLSGGASQLGQGRCNVVYSWHNYGAAGGGNVNTLAGFFTQIRNQNLPVIIGEFGYQYNGGSGTGSYQRDYNGAQTTFDNGPSNGIGMIWWHATGDSNTELKYSLKSTDATFYDFGNGNNLSPAGQRLWNIGHNKPNLGNYTGSLSASNCPSAAGR